MVAHGALDSVVLRAAQTTFLRQETRSTTMAPSLEDPYISVLTVNDHLRTATANIDKERLLVT